MIIQVNNSVHKTNDVKILFKKMKATVLFLTSFSPQFAPIEKYFGLLKRYYGKSLIMHALELVKNKASQ